MSLPNKKFPLEQKRFRFCWKDNTDQNGFHFSSILPFRKWELLLKNINEFTGFYDSQGTPVYESDILSDSHCLEEYVVYWCRDTGAWRLKGIGIDDFLFESVKSCHIIGNIYTGTYPWLTT